MYVVYYQPITLHFAPILFVKLRYCLLWSGQFYPLKLNLRFQETNFRILFIKHLSYIIFMHTLNMVPVNISTLYAISQYYFTPSIYLMHIPTDLDAPKRVHHLALFFSFFLLELVYGKQKLNFFWFLNSYLSLKSNYS